MQLLDENLLAEIANDTEVPGELGEEDKDFLESLEKMVEGVKDESGSID
jgi:hypothetical protein